MHLLIPPLTALLVTLGLFYSMQLMISGERQRVEPSHPLTAVSLVRLRSTEPGSVRPDLVGTSEDRLTSVTPPASSDSPDTPIAEPRVLEPSDTGMAEPGQLRSKGEPELGPPMGPAKRASPTPVARSGEPPEQALASAKPPDAEGVRSVVKARPAATASKTPSRGHARPATHRGTSRTRTSAKSQPPATQGPGRQGATGSRTRSSDRGSHDGVTRAAVAVRRPPPQYPPRAVRTGQEGWVRLEFTITADGRVEDPRVVDARPRRLFDRSALKAIRQWRFRPRMINGRAVAQRASQLIEFNLAN